MFNQLVYLEKPPGSFFFHCAHVVTYFYFRTIWQNLSLVGKNACVVCVYIIICECVSIENNSQQQSNTKI